MLMYKCEHCGQFTFLGYVNKLEEFFCNEKCYELYCFEKGFETHTNELRPVDGSKQK